MAGRPKGWLTFRITGVLFILSAVFELFTITSDAALFGEFRSGVAALLYHAMFIALYAALGIGILKARSWAYSLILYGTILITLDKLQYIVFREALLSALAQKLGPYREILQAIDPQIILQAFTVSALLFAAGWWGLAVYAYFRKDYFNTGGE